MVDECFGLRIGRVCPEDHVLIHVRETFVFRRLRERAVSDVDFDCNQRNTVILDDNHLEAVRQNLSLDDLLQLGALRQHGARNNQAHEHEKNQSSAPAEPPISL